ncbi:NUDIX domain-containing protein [Corallincola platygyrae]|uniref:NUDIX domain-containing protein n=1 Tax=Corallincola platygyrae TaxID=1193278 RepID=A0ABW4XHZ2_9GAMM
MSKPQIDGELWKHCPQCQSDDIAVVEGKAWRCGGCGFIYFHNVACAVGALICHQDRFLFAIRGKAPSLGMLDLPGGFVDADESMEQALCRELEEELGLQVSPESLGYLSSVSNRYQYSGVEYCTVDAVFSLTLDSLPELSAHDDISGFRWLSKQEAAKESFAFPSVQRIVNRWITSA